MARLVSPESAAVIHRAMAQWGHHLYLASELLHVVGR